MRTPTPCKTRTNNINGRGRIRTYEGISHQIYSLTPLATWVHARLCPPVIFGLPAGGLVWGNGDGVSTLGIGPDVLRNQARRRNPF